VATDPARALEVIDRAVALGNDGNPSDFNEWRELARVALRVALGEDDSTLARFDGISYSLSIVSMNTPDSAFDAAQRDGVREAIALLAAVRTEVEVTNPTAPAVDLNALHPWVSASSASLWSYGEHRQAVGEAARTIEVNLRAKLGLASGTGVPLVTGAFSKEAPKQGAPRLRFSEFTEGSENWMNAHEGAMSFGRGCMMRVRNLYQHGEEPSEQEALEALAALSLLARWIDQAEVVAAE
jgi:hypothetical protein